MSKRYYITTPIYYVNAAPHVGTALTTFAADVTARYRRMRGGEVFFLTGTDENGLKVFEAAQAAGRDPHEYVEEVGKEFEQIWRGLKISYNDFIRTTEPRHVACAQEFWKRLEAAGHIYRDVYEGWYDVSSETFYKESDLVDGKSPDGNEVRRLEEENWFFRLSAFQEPLLAHMESHPGFIRPEARRNEVLSFVRQGLRDVCVSRQNPGWGIPVPGDAERVMYVWFDALINYVSATGWPSPGWEQLWPSEVQWMGKDILTRFHATLWPAMLMGVGLPLPDALVGHAWMLMGGSKISKSKGNVVRPLELARELSAVAGCSEDLAVDAVRHYMAVSMPWENDRDFSRDEFDQRYNADLANDLGNALNRTLSMAHKFVEGVMPDAALEQEGAEAIAQARDRVSESLDEFRIDLAHQQALELVRFLNKYIDVRAPWALSKAQDPALASVLATMLACLRAAEGLVRPALPSAADAIAAQLGLEPLCRWEEIGTSASIPAGTKLGAPQPMFPRLDLRSRAPEAPKTEKSEAKPRKASPSSSVPSRSGWRIS